ncbi:MAG: biotin/lipoate A/B protein ligase family protein [Spirochaetes bacterium]|nr:biotin/lipoate A/B protein ligase family protein [Spirochaetota bacterium]
MKFRYLDTGAMPAALNMGIDEALLRAVSGRRSPPTLRLYRWEPSAVTIGYFQGMTEEVNLEACRRSGVDAVRRITGGGAVFHDAEITYSVVVPEGSPLAPHDILESYRLVCSGVIAGMTVLGIDAAFAPINDIVAQGRKISGNAQTRKLGCMLQHGTILLDVDVDRMFSLLLVPQEKLRGKLIDDVKERVTGLKSLLGLEIGYAETAAALKAGFSSAWSAELEPGELSMDELRTGNEIAAEKFGTDIWNLRR